MCQASGAVIEGRRYVFVVLFVVMVLEVLEVNDGASDVEVIVLVPDQVERGYRREGAEGGPQEDQRQVSHPPLHLLGTTVTFHRIGRKVRSTPVSR